MVATDPASTTSAETTDAGTTFGKIRQTLSSSLMTAQDKVTKMSPRPSLIPDMTSDVTSPDQPQSPGSTGSGSTSATQTSTTTGASTKPDPGKPPNRAGACRVCLKAFKPDDFSRTCKECHQRVCEDCASYSKLDENEDQSQWTCSICRRKLQSRSAIPQDSTDSLLDIPVLEALQRRHSDVKIGSGGLTVSGGGGGLAPPRSPELRRHSDVSPASLKELEKLKGTAAQGKSDMDWGPRSRNRSPPRRGSIMVEPITLSTVTTTPTTPMTAADGSGGLAAAQRAGRRMSRAPVRQHSYDDDIKTGTAGEGAGRNQTGGGETGLGLPAPIPRRASAYDVYAPGVLAAAQANARASVSGPSGPSDGAESISSRPSRRSSFRILPPEEPPKDNSPISDTGSTLIVDEDRRSRRRGSQLPDINTLRALPPTPWSAAALEELEAPRRQQSVDGDAIKIVIHDVDSGSSLTASKRRVLLRRDPADKAHRTRGFGMRVVGGKTGADGRLFAYIVWTVPGGPAEKGGLQRGDRVLEWGGVSLIDRSFEEVCAIMDHTGDTVELLVEHATDLRMCDLLEEPLPNSQRKGSEAMIGGLQIDIVSYSDRKFGVCESSECHSWICVANFTRVAKEQLAREKQVSGRVQLQVWYHDERRELVVAVLAGDDLAPRDDTLGYGNAPEAYAKLRLLPVTTDQFTVQTEVAPASQNPIWNANLSFTGIAGDELMDRSIEVTLWDLCPQSEPVFLGECTADLQKAFLDDRAVWYRLEDPRGLRGASPGKSPYASPRGSIGGDLPKFIKRGDFSSNRSVSDDVDSIGECASLLHPDYAWQIGGSRRGSSQSEQLEAEVYQLSKDYSKSLPGSRRSSLNKDQTETDIPIASPVNYHGQRRRSSCTRMLRDPDEILRSLKAVKGELGRTMSLSGASSKRRSSATSSRKDSIMDIPETPTRSPIDDDDKWGVDDLADSGVQLGPGQIQPRGYRITSAGRNGDVKLGLFMTKGQLEVEVIAARNIVRKSTDNPPDTYVKCYLRDGEQWIQKRKTRVARHSAEPQWKQTLRYQACDVLGRTLLVMLWERQGGFEHNQGLGGAEVDLNQLSLSHSISGWYPLFPIHSLGSDSNDSL